jgi:hypothetical protein
MLKGVLPSGLAHAQRHVALCFPPQPLTQLPAGDVLAVLTVEGTIVDHEAHGQCGFVDVDQGQWLGMLRVGQGVADVDPFEAHHGADVAAIDLRDLAPFEVFEDEKLLDRRIDTAAVPLEQGDLLARV